MIETKKDLKNLNFIKKMFIFAFMLIASFFVVNQQNTANIKAAEIGEPNVVIQGTYGDADPTSGEYAVTTAATTEFATPAQGRATGTKEQIIAGSTAKPIIKVSLTGMDKRIDTVAIWEYGSRSIVALATDGSCPTCILAAVTNDYVKETPSITNGETNSITFYYELQAVNKYGVHEVTLSLLGKSEDGNGDLFTQEITEKKNITVVKELVGSSRFFEPDAGDFALNVNNTSVYTVGDRNGNMTVHTNTSTDGSNSIVTSDVAYSGGNTDGKKTTKDPVTASFALKNDIAPATIKITRKIVGSPTGDTTNDITFSANETDFTFNTGAFINVNGFYDIVITDIFGYTHTLTIVVDFITTRDVSITVNYYIKNGETSYEITDDMTSKWVNRDVIMVATVSTTGDFIASDIYDVTNGGEFYYNVDSTKYPFNVSSDKTNHSNIAYALTGGKFIGTITVKFNESFSIHFVDRYGNAAVEGDTVTRNITNIDKVAPVINGSTGSIGSPTVPTTGINLMIDASTLKHATDQTHNSIFANNFLLGAAFNLHSGAYTITAADLPVTGGSVGDKKSAGFANSTVNQNMIVSYYKADGTTLIGSTTQGFASGDLNSDVTKELFEGRKVIVVIELKDYFPLVDTKLSLTDQTSGNSTFVKFEFTAFDNVAPVINVTAKAALHQQVQPQSNIDEEIHKINSRESILANYVVSVWDNFGDGLAVDISNFTYTNKTNNVWTFTHVARGLIIEIDMSAVHTNITKAGTYNITFTAYDTAANVSGVGSKNTSAVETKTYILDRMKVLLTFINGNFTKEYGAADPTFVGAATNYETSGQLIYGNTYYHALESYNLATRTLSRQTGTLGDKNYQEVLPSGDRYKLYQYWTNSGTTFADSADASISRINDCNLITPSNGTGCSNALVNDANHEIYFYIDGVVYASLEAYYTSVGGTADGRSKSTILGLTITAKSVTITPSATESTPFSVTYGTAVKDSDLTYNTTPLATANTNNGDSGTNAFTGALAAVDPHNVTKAEGVTSSNDGFIKRGNLDVKNNTWSEKNYAFNTTVFKTVGDIENVYTGVDTTGKKLIEIKQATLTIAPLPGQYKEIDYKGHASVKVQGSNAVTSGGVFSTTGMTKYEGDARNEYYFKATGWAPATEYATRDGSQVKGNLNPLFKNDIAVDFGTNEKVIVTGGTSTSPIYGGHVYTIGNLAFEYVDGGKTYNNYKVVLDSTYNSSSTPDKKFVIVKAQVHITTNNFEMTYGDTFNAFSTSKSGAQGTKTSLTEPAFRICRTQSTDVCDADALMTLTKVGDTDVIGYPINTLEQLGAVLKLSVNGFGDTTKIPAGIYRIEASIDGTTEIVDNFQFTFTNTGKLEVKSLNVYIGATKPTYTKTYGASDGIYDWGVYNAITGRISGLVNIDDRANAFTNTHTSILRESGEDVGTYAVNDTSTITAVAATHSTPINGLTPSSLLVEGTYYNYAKVVTDNKTAVVSTLTINKKVIDVNAIDLTKTYGDHDKTATFTSPTITDGDGQALVNRQNFNETNTSCTTNGGCDYPYVVSGLISNDKIQVNYGSYSVSIVDDTTARAMVIVSGKLVRAEGELATSTYAMSGSALAGNNNYLLSFISGRKLTVTKRHVTVAGFNYTFGTTITKNAGPTVVNPVEFYNNIKNQALGFDVIGMPTDGVVTDCAHKQYVKVVNNVADKTFSNNSSCDNPVFKGIVESESYTLTNVANQIKIASTDGLQLDTFGLANYLFDAETHYTNGVFVITSIQITLIVQNSEKIYGTDDLASHYVVKFKGTGSVLTPEDKTLFFGTGEFVSGNEYSVISEKLEVFKSRFGLIFSRAKSTTGDNVGSYTISLKGGTSGYEVKIITTDGSEVPLSSSETPTPSNAKLTITPKAVHIYAKPFDKIFDNKDAPAPTYYIFNESISDPTGTGRSILLGTPAVETYKNGLVNLDVKVLTDSGFVNVNIADGYGTATASNSLLEGVIDRYNNSVKLAGDQLKMAGITDVKLDGDVLATATNYSFTPHDNTYVISPKSVTITADNMYKVYGETDPTFTYSVVGFVADDTYDSKFTGAPVRLTADSSKQNAVDDINIVVSNNLGSDGVKVVVNSIGGYDYKIDYANPATAVKLKIWPRPVSVTTTGTFTKVYGEKTTSFVQDGYTATATSSKTLSGSDAPTGDWGLAPSEVKAVLNLGLWRYAYDTTTVITDETADTNQNVGTYDLGFLLTEVNTNYVVTYNSETLNTVGTKYKVDQDYTITKRTVAIDVTGNSATQVIEQRPDGANTTEINALKAALVYNYNSQFTGWTANTGTRTSDYLDGQLCYVKATDPTVCVEPDFKAAGNYRIVRAKGGTGTDNFLRVTNATYDVSVEYIYNGLAWVQATTRGAYEDANYSITFTFNGSASNGTLTISADKTSAVFYVGSTEITETTLTYAAVLTVTDAKNNSSSFHTIGTTTHTGASSQVITKGKLYPSAAENIYSYSLRTRFSLQAYDYYIGSITNKQTQDANLYWTCTVKIGEADIACENTAFIDSIVKAGKIGKYTITYTVYDETYTGAVDTGNPASVSGDLYIIDTVAPTTGNIGAYSKASDGTVLVNDTWTNKDGVYFKITGGSDDSFGGYTQNASSQWWHRFSLDGGTTWYDYTVNGEGVSNIIQVLSESQEGQVTITIDSYDNRLSAGTWSDNVYSGAAIASVKYFENGSYTPKEDNVYGSVKFGVQKTFTITVDTIAPSLNVVDGTESNLEMIEVGNVNVPHTPYVEKGFAPTDSTDISQITKAGEYTIKLTSPTSADRLNVCSITIYKGNKTEANTLHLVGENCTMTAEQLTQIAAKVIYEHVDGVYQQGLYEIHYEASDRAGNSTLWERRILVKDLRPQWLLNLSSTDSGSVEQLKLGNEIQVDAGSQFTIPMFYAVDYQGNQLLNVEISRVITFEGRVVDEIDTSLVGEYIISYNGVGGEHNLAAQTLNLRVTVLPNDDLSSMVVNSNNSFIYMMMVVGLAFIGLSLSYVIIRKKS